MAGAPRKDRHSIRRWPRDGQVLNPMIRCGQCAISDSYDTNICVCRQSRMFAVQGHAGYATLVVSLVHQLLARLHVDEIESAEKPAALGSTRESEKYSRRHAGSE